MGEEGVGEGGGRWGKGGQGGGKAASIVFKGNYEVQLEFQED